MTCPIIVIFGTHIFQTVGHQKMVSLTNYVQQLYLGNFSHPESREFSIWKPLAAKIRSCNS